MLRATAATTYGANRDAKPKESNQHLEHLRMSARQLRPDRIIETSIKFWREIPILLWNTYIEAFLIPSYRPEWTNYSTWHPRPAAEKAYAKEQAQDRKDAFKKRRKMLKLANKVPKPVLHNHTSCATLRINVSGKIYQPQMKTLVQYPNTLLGDPERLAQYFDPRRNDYFFDRSRICFDAIIYYYQSRGILRKPYNTGLEIFEEELKFFDLGQAVIDKWKRDEGIIIDIEKPIPRKLLQRKLWLLLEYPESSYQARIVAFLSILVIIVSIFIFCLETVNAYQQDTEVHDQITDPFFFTETICISWFIFEFVLRAITSPRKTVFFKSISNLIDLFAIFPYFLSLAISQENSNRTSSLTILRVVRLVRVFRILKLSRHNRGLKVLGKTLKASIRELGLLMFFLGIGVILFSSAVYFSDQHHPNTHFKSIIGAFWWSIITMTTCGFGDDYPVNIRTHGWESIDECQMKHPKSGKKSLFLLDTGSSRNDGNLLFEVLTMQHETRSWFVDNTVISDGNIYVCTPVDPLFFVIPVMEKSSKAKPLIDHLVEGSLPKAVADVFTKRLSHKQLECVSIKKDFEDFVAFLYSEERTIKWLSNKVEKVSQFLMDKGISQAESSISSNFVKSSAETLSKEDCLRYACDIVGEYIDETLKKKLLEKLGLPILQEKAGTKRKSSLNGDDENINKKTKISGDDPVMPLEDYGSSNSNAPVNKNVKVTTKEKELQKAAQGSHSLFKFFAPKAK